MIYTGVGVTVAEEQHSLGFPDAARARLDESIATLVADAQRVLSSQGRLRSLLDANRLVAEQIELPVVLRTIVEAATSLVGAQYGAIGVIAPDGTLEQFIHVGMTDEIVAAIGTLPEGHGILGALIEEQEPIRLEHLSHDPRSIGFPTAHPAMDSFLGVPVRVRGEVYGNLYLSQRSGGSFSQEDEELLVALAGTAGAAIDHARLFDESQRRQRWSSASAQVTSALLSDEVEDSLSILADRVASLADADLVCVAIPAGATSMVVQVARGDLADEVQGTTFESAGTLAGRAYESRQPVLSDVDSEQRIHPAADLGPTMALPLMSTTEPSGVLTVSRLPGRPRFTRADLEMAADFASQASVALRLSAGQRDRQRVAVLEDRGRIARDLHDHVIQRLFGAGLSLQAIAKSLPDDAAARVADQVDVLDAAIAEIRTAIFTITTSANSERSSIRHRIIDLVGETSDLFADSPQLNFVGPVDLLVAGDLADDVVAVVREGLTNVARHAAAHQTTVAVAVADQQLTVVITDDGVGVDPSTAGVSSGTANLLRRAQSWGGTFSIAKREPSGTALTWTARLDESEVSQ